MSKLLLATSNSGKLEELRALLADLVVDLVTPNALGLDLAVDETGHGYAENASLKARASAAASGLPALADDSGLRTTDAIGVRVGKVVDRYKVAKHFDLEITEGGFAFSIHAARVAAEAALDGVYVVRTSVPASRLDSAQTVLAYKRLAHVERAFRSLKTLDLYIRPIHHRLEDRVRAHIFLCMLAYYVQWHMVEAWRPLLFHDEDLAAKEVRDPVAPARRSAAAQRKAEDRFLPDGSPVHSFRTLLADLATIVSNTCRRPGAAPDEACFELITQASPQQRRAYTLLDSISA